MSKKTYSYLPTGHLSQENVFLSILHTLKMLIHWKHKHKLLKLFFVIYHIFNTICHEHVKNSSYLVTKLNILVECFVVFLNNYAVSVYSAKVKKNFLILYILTLSRAAIDKVYNLIPMLSCIHRPLSCTLHPLSYPSYQNKNKESTEAF